MLLVSLEQVPKAEQHSYAHGLLCRALREFGVDYAEGVTPVNYGEHGKPALVLYPELRFNISHADGIAAAFVSEYECGVDCERVREFDPRVMKRVCSETEQAAINSAPENGRDLLFFGLWTLKEAYVKALGRGLSFPLKNAEFTLREGEILTNLKGCAFSQYVIGSEFVVSVCELKSQQPLIKQ